MTVLLLSCCIASPADYIGQSGALLSFNTGVRLRCHTVQINDDDLCEQPAGDVFLQLSYVLGLMPITVNPDMARVIINDDDESECGEYNDTHFEVCM